MTCNKECKKQKYDDEVLSYKIDNEHDQAPFDKIEKNINSINVNMHE